jgi:hypothetical protein
MMMKKILFPSLLAVALTAASFMAPTSSLVGRWQKRFPNGDVLLASFRTDGTYDLFVNNKTFVSGKYTLQQDNFALNDGHCSLAYFGTYKLRFYSNDDSIRFTVVQDTCRARRRGSDGLTLGRVKAVKP